MKKENRELMEQMLMAIHAKDTLEMLEELIENSLTGKSCWISSGEILICSSKTADWEDIFCPQMPVSHERLQKTIRSH